MGERNPFTLKMGDIGIVETLELHTRDTENDGTRFLGTVKILGGLHHIEFIEVKLDEAECQVATNPEFEQTVEGMHQINDTGGAFHTVEINGREYVCNVVPYK